jgi:hypothetical protein
MARIAISESSNELRHLFRRIVERLGHEPVELEASGADAALIDPDIEGGTRDVRAPDGLPVIVCSIYPPGPETAHLAAVTHLLKPFTDEQLQRAIGRALPV